MRIVLGCDPAATLCKSQRDELCVVTDIEAILGATKDKG